MNLRVFISTLTAVLALGATNSTNAQFPACSFTNTPLSGTGPDPIGFVRMALRANGTAVLAYTTTVTNGSNLYFYNCADSTCSTGQAILLDTAQNYAGAPGIVIRANGRPAITAPYNGGARFYDCADSACASIMATDIRPSGSAIFSSMPMALQFNGNPVIAYLDGSTSARPRYLIAYFCNDATCVTGTEQTLAVPLAANNIVFSQLSLTTGDDGRVAATYLSDAGQGAMVPIGPVSYQIARCTNLSCTSVQQTELSSPVGSSSPNRTAIAVRSTERPLALDSQAANPALLDCTTANCTAAANEVLPASAAGQPLGLGLLPGDLPAFALFNSATVSAFACDNTTCTSGTPLTTTNSTTSIIDGDFALDVNLHPAISYIDATTANISLAACFSDEIFANNFGD